MNSLNAHEVMVVSPETWRTHVREFVNDHAASPSVVFGETSVFSRLLPATSMAGVCRAGNGVRATGVTLKAHSAFYGLRGRRYCGPEVGSKAVRAQHCATNPNYVIRTDALEARSLISVSQVRPHRLAGIAASVHNVLSLGANGNFAPHHSIGTPKTGGDSFSANSLRFHIASSALWFARSRMPALGTGPSFLNRVQLGGWDGNDTLWRSLSDMARIALYAKRDGDVADVPQREVVACAVLPTLRAQGAATSELIIAGRNAVAVDIVSAKLCGFEWSRIPHLIHAFDDHDLRLVNFTYDDIKVVSEFTVFDRRLVQIADSDCKKAPLPAGWPSLRGA